MVDRSYSKEVRYIIKTLGINENMMANRCDISRDTVIKILRGHRDVKYSTLDKIIKSFFIDKEWFYNGLNEPFRKEYGSYKDAGKRIKEIRIKKGLTLRDFAYKCDIDYAALCRVENGKAKLSLTTANKIAKGFKVDIDYLMFGFR